MILLAMCFLGNRLTLIKEIFNSKGIIVTSYQGVLKFKGHLVELDWHYVILDEGHKIRNPTAKVRAYTFLFNLFSL